MNKNIILYRHGQTDYNVKDITMGQLENIKTNFTDVGYEEINEIKENIKLNNIEIIYTSDFNRTVDIAKK